MQRLTSQYRASLILAAANAGLSPAAREAPESRGDGRGSYAGDRHGYGDAEDFAEDFITDHRDIDYRDLSGAEYEDQPTYWYWSFDHPDSAI